MKMLMTTTADGGRLIEVDMPAGKGYFRVDSQGRLLDYKFQVTQGTTFPPPAPTPAAERARLPEIASHLLQGAIGMAKAKLGVDRTSDEERNRRLKICEDCEMSLPKNVPILARRCGKLWDIFRTQGQGTGCGCGIALAVRVASKECPLGKWETDIPGSGS